MKKAGLPIRQIKMEDLQLLLPRQLLPNSFFFFFFFFHLKQKNKNKHRKPGNQDQETNTNTNTKNETKIKKKKKLHKAKFFPKTSHPNFHFLTNSCPTVVFFIIFTFEANVQKQT